MLESLGNPFDVFCFEGLLPPAPISEKFPSVLLGATFPPPLLRPIRLSKNDLILQGNAVKNLKELKEAGLIQGEVNPPKIKYCINQENWKKAKALFYNFFDKENLNKKIGQLWKLYSFFIYLICIG